MFDSDGKRQDVSVEAPAEGSVFYRLCAMLLAVECRSSHPIAKGIANYCTQMLAASSFEALSSLDVLEFENVSGKGVKMTFKMPDDGMTHSVVVGSAHMLEREGITIPPNANNLAFSIRSEGKIVVLVATDGVLTALLGLGDRIRPEARAVLSHLRRAGIDCHMVTGDNAVTAHAIGALLDIAPSNILAGASPADKETYVEGLQVMAAKERGSKNKVAFVGDGTNDTPALSKAQVGFVMSGGTDLALEFGDIVLCRNSLESLAVAIDLSVTTMRRIYINYFWALVYNCILIPIAAGVLLLPVGFTLNPMYAGAAMGMSSICVVISSLLLLYYAPPLNEAGYGVEESRSVSGNEA